MVFKSAIAGLAGAILAASAALAGEIEVHDPYMRAARPGAPTGAAFMMLMNTGEDDDRLIGAASDIAKRVELHTHRQDANGMMSMVPIEGGIPLPAGGHHALQRGGDHVMLMGLTRGLEPGETVPITLIFEQAGEIEVQFLVDPDRKPEGHGAGHKSGN